MRSRSSTLSTYSKRRTFELGCQHDRHCRGDGSVDASVRVVYRVRLFAVQIQGSKSIADGDHADPDNSVVRRYCRLLHDALDYFRRDTGVQPPNVLVLIYAGGGIASNTFILKGYIDSISTELDDAARIDGCGNLQVYRLVIMPIVRPMLAIIALWSFIGPFLDYMLPSILLSDPKQYTLATGLYTLITDVRNMHQPVFAAGGLLTALPIIILFIALQNQLVSGLASGAVKG